MRTIYRTGDDRAYFVVADLDSAYHESARQLGFEPVEDGWARAFPAASPHLDRAYENFARCAEEYILQRAGARPVPWQRALETFLRLVEGRPIAWWLVGSAALSVRGLDVAPGDLDLVVDDASARPLGDALLDYLIEPVVPVHGWVCNWFGRSFPGACLEWVGGVDGRADTPQVSDFGPAAVRRAERVLWHGYRVPIPPLDLQLAVNERRGRHERAALIRRARTGPL